MGSQAALLGKGALGASQEQTVEVDHAGAIRVSSPSSPVTHGTLGPGPAPGRGDLGAVSL